MTLPEAIEIVEHHRAWQKGAEIEMIKPAIFFEAIDKILHAAKCYDMIITMTNKAYESK